MAPLWKSAAICILIGSLLLIGPAFSFSSLAADRGVSISTAAHSDALIGITAQSSTVADHNKQTDLATVTSNVNAIDISTITTDDITVSDSEGLLNLYIEEGDSQWTISGSCAWNKASGKTDVTITVKNATGNGISVMAVTRTIRDVSVTCSDDGDFTADWYEFTDEYSGNSHDIAFTIQNTHNKSVTVTGIKVEDTHNNPAQSYEVVDISIVGGTEEEGIRNNRAYSVGAEESHDSLVIDPGDEAEYSIEGFDRKVKGDNTVITIYTEGGS